jgi:hypothetical protein
VISRVLTGHSTVSVVALNAQLLRRLDLEPETSARALL